MIDQHFSVDEEARGLCVIGLSGTGKTRLLRHLCELKGKPVLLVGGHLEQDFEDFPLPITQVDSLQSEELFSAVDTTLCIDDLFSLDNKRDHEAMRRLLCKRKRHFNCTVLVAIHTIANTRIFGVMNQFDFVSFTHQPKHDPNVAAFLRIFRPASITRRTFQSIKEFCYLLYHTRTDAFVMLNSSFQPTTAVSAPVVPGEASDRADDQAASLMVNILPILRVFDSYKMTKTHLKFLLKNVDPLLIDQHDFTVTLMHDVTKRCVKISLVDYLLACQNPSHPVDEKLRIIHRFFNDQFFTPRCLISNNDLKSMKRP